MDHWDEWEAAELQAARLRQQFKQLRSEYGKAKRDFEASKLAFFTTAERAECTARCLGDVVLDWETAKRRVRRFRRSHAGTCKERAQ